MTERQVSILLHTLEGIALVEIPAVIVWLNLPNSDPKILLAGLLGGLVQWLRANQTVK